jgi:ribosomal protein S18 acetylase RimI-like enzyme
VTDPQRFELHRLSDQHITGPFKAGDSLSNPLKIFLQKQALDFQQAMVAQTYVATLPGSETVIGFITLTCSEIDLENGYSLEDCPYANRYPTMPAVKIARLAVDCRYRGQGIGIELVDLALAIAKYEIAPLAGCRFVVTDAKAQAVSFYEQQGFTRLNSADNQNRDQPVMFVDLRINAE